eukprot:TRINITY_DN25679_c0_g1_i1.p1 TRINITY_DN25679_c0_g1~~TRINITY_DN25679_c0_g1_i1.p1  ORF type:complete len:328 (+),score=107.40 TRINITY_DN25679_c0_g1_i1:69-1052(+)
MAPIEEIKEKEGPEDTPFVKELKVLCDQVLDLEKKFDQEQQDIRSKYEARQKALLDERAKVLAEDESGSSSTGTPALPGFWAKALMNHPAFEEEIEEYDVPVLQYLRDIQYEFVSLSPQVFKLRFLFAENPYFENTELVKEYTNEWQDYSGEYDVKEVTGQKIEWKDGKDVTVEKVKSKKGAKKGGKAKKESIEPRPSFFRSLERSLKQGQELPEDIDPMELAMALDCESDDEMDEEELVDALMQQDFEAAEVIRDTIIPYAVRWYTGEADPRDDDDDEDEESEDDDDDDESEEAPLQKGKKGGDKAKKKDAPADGNQKKEEECKQQ